MNDCEFSFKDTVRVTEGFYKGFDGKVEEFRVGKENYEYLVKLDVVKKSLWFKESSLKRKLMFKIPFVR